MRESCRREPLAFHGGSVGLEHDPHTQGKGRECMKNVHRRLLEGK